MAGPDFPGSVSAGRRVVLNVSTDVIHSASQGSVMVKDVKGNDLILLEVSSLMLAGDPSHATLIIRARGIDAPVGQAGEVTEIIRMGPERDRAVVRLGAGKSNGNILLYDKNATNNRDNAQATIHLDGASGEMSLRDGNGHHSLSLHGNIDGYTGLWLGANVQEGKKAAKIFLRDGNGNESVILDGLNGNMYIKDSNNLPSFSFISRAFNSNIAGLFIGATIADGEPKPGQVLIRDRKGNDSIILDGAKGDISLPNADCAEEFDISSKLTDIEPGTVMVIGNDGKLQISSKAYDKRVAGVISGGGNFKPGIVLDKKLSQNLRAPLALLGKVYCKVYAHNSSIKVGDMLTTSNTPGYAMKATNQSKAFGAVIGKALDSINSGKRLMPILLALQ